MRFRCQRAERTQRIIPESGCARELFLSPARPACLPSLSRSFPLLLPPRLLQQLVEPLRLELIPVEEGAIGGVQVLRQVGGG